MKRPVISTVSSWKIQRKFVSTTVLYIPCYPYITNNFPLILHICKNNFFFDFTEVFNTLIVVLHTLTFGYSHKLSIIYGTIHHWKHKQSFSEKPQVNDQGLVRKKQTDPPRKTRNIQSESTSIHKAFDGGGKRAKFESSPGNSSKIREDESVLLSISLRLG